MDGDGCSTRDQVLYSTVDKGSPVAFGRQGWCPTDMAAGTWIDFYA